MKTKLKPYSVLLLYPDYIAETFGQETYYAWVRAKNSMEAVAKAQKEAAKHNPTYFDEDGGSNEADDFYPLLCIKGHHLGENTDG